MKVTLVNPPIIIQRKRINPVVRNLFYNSPPLGLAYLAAVLEQKGIAVSIIDAAVEELTYSQVIERINSFCADIVGITTLTSSFYSAIELAKRLKSEKPSLSIVIGGPHVSANPFQALSHNCFDVGVIGEGEMTFPILIDNLIKNKELNEVDGVIFCRNNELYCTKPREYITNLDNLPLPARHLLPIKKYVPQPNDERVLPKLSVITSRGCPHSCIYCDKNVFGFTYRSFSPGYIVREMKHLQVKYGARDIAFLDSVFAVNKDKIMELTNEIKKHNLKISWTCSIRVNLVTEELLWRMKEAGCWRVRLGVESGNEEVLKFLKRNTTKKQIRDAVIWAHKLKLQPKGFFMVGHLIDTEDTIKESIGFARSLPFKDITVQINTPLSNTYQYKIRQSYGKLVSSDNSEFNFWQPVFVPNKLTKERLIALQKKFYRSFYLRPVVFWRHLRAIRSLRDIKRYLKSLKLLFHLFVEDRAEDYDIHSKIESSKILSMGSAELDKVIYLYTNYLEHSFFSKFGPKFIRYIFQEMAFSKVCVNLTYKESDKIVAFISAATNAKKLFRDILFKKWHLLTSMIFFNMTKMRQFKNIMDTFLYFSKVSEVGIDAELLFIAIEPNYRKKGIARSLIEHTLKELKCRGIQAVKVSVEKNNAPVNQLLEKMKFCRRKTFSLFKKEMNLYTYTLR